MYLYYITINFPVCFHFHLYVFFGFSGLNLRLILLCQVIYCVTSFNNGDVQNRYEIFVRRSTIKDDPLRIPKPVHDGSAPEQLKTNSELLTEESFPLNDKRNSASLRICRSVCRYCSRVMSKRLSALCFGSCRNNGREFRFCLTAWMNQEQLMTGELAFK